MTKKNTKLFLFAIAAISLMTVGIISQEASANESQLDIIKDMIQNPPTGYITAEVTVPKNQEIMVSAVSNLLDTIENTENPETKQLYQEHLENNLVPLMAQYGVFLTSDDIKSSLIPTEDEQTSQSELIPAWIKRIVVVWAEDKITDTEFVDALDFLIEAGVIKVPKIQELENRIVELENDNIELQKTIPLQNCDDSYLDVCIDPYPPDLNCGDIRYSNFKVTGSDPHGFDMDNDGIGCESGEIKKDVISNSELQELKQLLDDLQYFPKATLKQCNNVNSYEDYSLFIAISTVANKINFGGKNMSQITEDLNTSLMLIESSEYGNYSQIKKEIEITRSLYTEAGICMDQLHEKYEQ